MASRSRYATPDHGETDPYRRPPLRLQNLGLAAANLEQRHVGANPDLLPAEWALTCAVALAAAPTSRSASGSTVPHRARRSRRPRGAKRPTGSSSHRSPRHPWGILRASSASCWIFVCHQGAGRLAMSLCALERGPHPRQHCDAHSSQDQFVRAGAGTPDAARIFTTFPDHMPPLPGQFPPSRTLPAQSLCWPPTARPPTSPTGTCLSCMTAANRC